MSILDAGAAITRFTGNEDRFDTFVNGIGTYATSSGTTVETIQSFMARMQTQLTQNDNASLLGGYAPSQSGGNNKVVVTTSTGNISIGGSVTAGSGCVVGTNSSTATVTAGGTDSSLSLSAVGTTGALIFKTNGTERGRIGANGIFGISGGTDYHYFSRNASGQHVLGAVNSATSAPSGMYVLFDGTSNSTGTFLKCQDFTAIRCAINGNGNIQNYNNSYGSLSDVKLKENIGTARNYLEDLNKVRVVRFSFKKEHAEAPTHLGVIAQELEQIFPGMIEEIADTALRQKVDESGVPVMEEGVNGELRPVMESYLTGETTKTVKYSIFVPMLLTAVQELSAKVAALEARLTP